MTLVSPAYLIGKGLSNAIVTGYTATVSGGTVTYAPSTDTFDISTLGFCDVIEIERSRSLAQIQPVNSGIDNFVPLTASFTATVNEIRRADGGSSLEVIGAGYDYIGVTTKVKAAGAVTFVITLIGVIETLRNGGIDVEKNLSSMTIRPIGYSVLSGTGSLTGTY